MTHHNFPARETITMRSFTVNGVTFTAPIAMIYIRNGGATACVGPEMTDAGEHVYAMPGGGRITASGEVIRWAHH